MPKPSKAALVSAAKVDTTTRLLAFVAAQREHFEANATDAKAAASSGRPESADEAASATWTAFARVVLNLDEFITRE